MGLRIFIVGLTVLVSFLSATDHEVFSRCGTNRLQNRVQHLSTKSIHNFQTNVSASKAHSGLNKSFRVFSFLDSSTYSVSATVRYFQTLPNGLDLAIWVEDTLWNSTSSNHLNAERASSNLIQERQTTIEEIGAIMSSIVIPKLEEVYGPINELANPALAGMHVLIYDIKDNFANDGGFVGGFFDPFDQSIRGENMNLIHMDAYPSNPAGWEDPKIPVREDFFYTLAHELFHLIHYQVAGDNTWGQITQWFSEGLAQFSIFRTFQGALYPLSSAPILQIPQKAPSQVSFYLEFPAITYLLEGTSETSPLSVEFYGLGYLFFSHLWTYLESDGDRIFGRLLEEKIRDIHGLRSILASNGYEFEKIFEDFAIKQFFGIEPLKFDFIDLKKDSYSGRFNGAQSLNLSSSANSRIAQTKMYEIAYWDVSNTGTTNQKIRLESKCSNSFQDTCGVCGTPFQILQLPSREALSDCEQKQDPLGCYYGLNRNRRSLRNNLSTLSLKPGTSTFIAWWSKESTCIRGTNELHVKSVESEDFAGQPFFSEGPAFLLTNNRLETTLRVQDDNSPKATLRFLVSNQDSPISFIPNSTNGMESPTISVGETISMTWYFLEEQWSIDGSRIQIQLFDNETSSIGEGFHFQIFDHPEIARKKIAIEFMKGWNMLAFNPLYESETWGDLFDHLKSDLSFSGCSYGHFDSGLVAISANPDECSSTSSAWRSKTLEFGDGFWVNAAESKTILVESALASRAKLKLRRGWNLKSLQLNSPIWPDSFSHRIPIIYRFEGQSGTWKKKVFFGLDAPDHISDEMESFHPNHAHWIYSTTNKELVHER